MIIKKTAAAEKAEKKPESKLEKVFRPLQTEDIMDKLRPEAEEPEYPPFERRIQTSDVRGGKIEISDRDYVTRFASAVDWASFRSLIEARRRTTPEGWRELPGGRRIAADRVLMICSSPNCKDAFWADPVSENKPCLRCNIMRTKSGGHYRRASEKEVAAWFIAEEKRLAAWKADSARRRAEVDAVNRRRFFDEGQRIGVDLTFKTGD